MKEKPTATVCMKSTTFKKRHMKVYDTEFHSNWPTCVGSIVRNSLAPGSKVWLSLCRDFKKVLITQ